MDDGGGGGGRKTCLCVCIIICTACKNVCYYLSVTGIFPNSTCDRHLHRAAAQPAAQPARFRPSSSRRARHPHLRSASQSRGHQVRRHRRRQPRPFLPHLQSEGVPSSCRCDFHDTAALWRRFFSSASSLSARLTHQQGCWGDWCCCRSWLYHKC